MCGKKARVSARRLHDGDAFVRDMIAEERRRGDPVSQILFIERLVQSDGNRFQVAASPAQQRLTY